MRKGYIYVLRDTVWLWKFTIFCRLKRIRYQTLPYWLKRILRQKKPPQASSQDMLVPKAIPKTIWMFWYQGWKSAPAVVQVCRESWINANRGWKVRSLSVDDVSTYVNLHDVLRGKKISHTTYADVLRVNLLARYGGVWVDATTFCATPLDQWLLPLMQSGFFAFSRPGPDRIISNWFIASQRDNPSIECWRKHTERACLLTEEEDPYFWLDRRWHRYLFEEGLLTNPSARSVWLNTPHVSADGSHIVQWHLRQGSAKDDVLQYFCDGRIPIHKLSWKIDIPIWFLHTLREVVTQAIPDKRKDSRAVEHETGERSN
jgi:hypothetical protein